MPNLDHVDLVVTSLERSLPFYRQLLAPLGWRWVHRVEGERGEEIHYLFGMRGGGAIGLRERRSGPRSEPYDRYAVGVHHLAFAARSRRAVDQVAQLVREQQAEIESGPQEYAYSPGYYAVFFYDPDGIKLEVLHRPRLRTVLWSLRPATTPFRSENRARPR